MTDIRIITLDPGHFHAALVQKEPIPGAAPQVHIYAPLGPDLLAHLGRIAAFNTRRERPTAWELEVHTGGDPLERLLRERPGNVVVLSGRNRGKIHRIKAAVEAGLHVLADKPWVIDATDLPILKDALDAADRNNVVAYDIMTERFEITSILQRELVNDTETFGKMQPGTEAEPGVFLESMHYLMKLVAGSPLRRPPWFFDVTQQGEGLSDVGTHLVDLVMWILFPNQSVDSAREVALLAAKRWPTVMSRADFQRVTGEAEFPDYLAGNLRDGALDYFYNTLVSYTVRGVHVKLNVLWDYETTAGAGDTHFAVFRGSRSRVEVRQGREENYRPELYVVPNRAAELPGIVAAIRKKITAYPGVAVVERDGTAWVTIPDSYRIGHEAHFGEVTRQFLTYLRNRSALPAWEKPNMLAKYHITTGGVRLAAQSGGQ